MNADSASSCQQLHPFSGLGANHFLLHDIDLYKVPNRERASNARSCQHTGRLVRRAIQARLCGAASAREVPAHDALLYCASMARQQGVAAIISEQLWALVIARQPLLRPGIDRSTSNKSILQFPDFLRAATDAAQLSDTVIVLRCIGLESSCTSSAGKSTQYPNVTAERL